MEFNLVSTIIPVYNRPDRLREAVASVLAQNYRPIEILIVDDGSTDGLTVQTAQELALANPSLIRVVTQTNLGPGMAREKGRQLARGEFIQYLDSDDLLLPEKFSLQVGGLRENPKAGISYGVTLACDERTGLSKITHGTDIRHRKIFPAIFSNRIWHTITPLYRRSVSDAIGSWSSKKIFEDWDYDCRAGFLDVELHYCEQVIAIHNLHNGEHSGHAWQHNINAMRDRTNFYIQAITYANLADLKSDEPEMQKLIQSAFRMVRVAGAAGLSDVSRELFKIAKKNSGRNKQLTFNLSLYGMFSKMVGWKVAGKVGILIDKQRGQISKFRL